MWRLDLAGVYRMRLDERCTWAGLNGAFELCHGATWLEAELCEAELDQG